MRWPWSRKTESGEGTEARIRSEVHLEQSRAQWPEVRRISASLRDIRQRNHFAETLTHIFRGEA